MRVLQVMAGAPYGGAEAFFTRLAVALHRAGLDQQVLMRPSPPREQVLQENGIAPVLARFGVALDIASRLAFKRQVREFKPHIVMTWMTGRRNFVLITVPRTVPRVTSFILPVSAVTTI